MAKKRNVVETHVHITPAGLEKLASEIWGKEWRSKFSEVLGISYSQLHRYMTVYKGQTIPQVVVVALAALRALKGPEGETIISIAGYRAPIGDLVPVKFVQEPKPVKPRTLDTTPVVDFFGMDDTAPEIVAETPPAPSMPEPEPVAKKAAPKRKMPPKPAVAAKPAAKPVKAKTKSPTSKVKAA